MARRQATVTLTRDASMHADVHRAQTFGGFNISFIFVDFQFSWARRPPAFDRGAQVPRYLQILADFSRCFADGLKMCKDFPRFHDGNSLGTLGKSGEYHRTRLANRLDRGAHGLHRLSATVRGLRLDPVLLHASANLAHDLFDGRWPAPSPSCSTCQRIDGEPAC